MKDLSRSKGRQPTKAERKAATQEQAERRAATPFMPAKPKREPLARRPGKPRDPGRTYSAEEVRNLIKNRPDLRNEMELSPPDK